MDQEGRKAIGTKERVSFKGRKPRELKTLRQGRIAGKVRLLGEGKGKVGLSRREEGYRG